MTDIRVVVADDEPLVRRGLRTFITAEHGLSLVGEARNGREAVDVIRAERPDLVFLDVQMPECGGFDVLEMLGADLPHALIFVTAHDEYALRAFEAGALDYLLKPFDDARFGRALNRAKDKLAHFLPLPRPPARRLVVRSPGQLIFLDVADIDWVEAAGYYACLHVRGTTHILRRALTDLERDLDAENFVRIHRSVIVNLARVQGLELQGSGDYEVVLKSGARLRLSRRFRKRLQDRLEGR